MSIDQMSVGKDACRENVCRLQAKNKMSLGQNSLDEMSKLNVYSQNACRQNAS